MDLSFHLKHWIFTLIVGPLLAIILMPILHGHGLPELRSLDFAFLIFIFSIPCSMPAAILYLIAGYSLNLAPINYIVKKTTLIIFAIVGIFLTFKTIAGMLEIEFAFFYVAATILTGLFLRLQKPIEQSSN
ncbi:MAG: hypothetical protein QM726_19925 [Chitinophagaceae bacterium]